MRLIHTQDFNSSPIHEVVRSGELQGLQKINTVLMIVGPVVLMTVGFTGNVLTIFVLSRRAMKDNLFSVYLISLCVSNIITLSVSMPRFLGAAITGAEFWAYDKDICPYVRWLTFTVISINSWHVVVITGCRLCFLLPRKRTIPTCIRPHVTIVTLCCVIGAVEVVLIKVGIQNKDRNGYTAKCNFVSRSFIILSQFIIFCGAPAILLLFFNATLFFVHHRKDSGFVSNSSTLRARQQLLGLVLVSSLTFILTAFPCGLMYMNINVMFDLSTPLGLAKGELMYNCAVLLLYLNNAMNFLVYCCFGRKFRREFFKLVRSEASRDSQNVSSDENPTNPIRSISSGPVLASIMKGRSWTKYKEPVISASDPFGSSGSLHTLTNAPPRRASNASQQFATALGSVYSQQESHPGTFYLDLQVTPSERDLKKHVPTLQNTVLTNLADYTFLSRRSSSASSSVDRRSVYFFNKVSARNVESP